MSSGIFRFFFVVKISFFSKACLPSILISLKTTVLLPLVLLGIVGCSHEMLAPLLVKDITVETAVPVYRRGVRLRPDEYVVKRGDSLYGIAWRFGVDYRNLVSWNTISDRDLIYEGQVLILKGAASRKAKTVRAVKARSGDSGRKKSYGSEVDWFWPATGSIKVVKEGSKVSGLEISGREGSPITASAQGIVVYSGAGLKGYGELIIIKHNESFLSAYAHSKIRLVKEGEKVVGKQLIARMGSSGSANTMLYFEIRRDGKAVDPNLYLSTVR